MLGVFCWMWCKESGDDAAGSAGFAGVGAQGVLGREVLVTFDGKSHGATECLDLGEADIAEFGEAESQVHTWLAAVSPDCSGHRCAVSKNPF